MATDKVITKTASHPEKYKVEAQKLRGVLAFVRANDQCPWNSISPILPLGTVAPTHCPYPLFQNKDAAIAHVRDTVWMVNHDIMMFEVME